MFHLMHLNNSVVTTTTKKMQLAIYSIFLLHNLKRKFTLLDTLNHFHLSFEEFSGIGYGFLNSSPCKRMIACNISLKYLLTVSPERLKWCFMTWFFAWWASVCRNMATCSSTNMCFESFKPPIVSSILHNLVNAFLFILMYIWRHDS